MARATAAFDARRGIPWPRQGAWLGLIAPALGSTWTPVVQHALFATCAWAVLLWLYRRRIFFKL